MFEVILILTVGIIWGSTNYLIELYYYDYSQIENETNFIKRTYKFLIKNVKPLLFFIFNQLGSVLFYISLGKLSLSLTVIISNSVSFITTFIFELLHKRKKFQIGKK